jgi:hypothetical protein
MDPLFSLVLIYGAMYLVILVGLELDAIFRYDEKYGHVDRMLNAFPLALVLDVICGTAVLVFVSFCVVLVRG